VPTGQNVRTGTEWPVQPVEPNVAMGPPPIVSEGWLDLAAGVIRLDESPLQSSMSADYSVRVAWPQRQVQSAACQQVMR